ncbi:MAG: PD-(D/E)XK nuclease family protein [Proteobacteria bacterium]|nr:PD-(D/E)XK nuclease family protein [Pseudomonadota bacterium]
MTAIAENDFDASTPAVLAAWDRLLDELAGQLRELAAHPARSVVLLPYAQLMPLLAARWAARFPDSFAPRFETTRNWAARIGLFTPGPNDVSFDHGRDLLTAASLLDGAGLGAQRQWLAGPLLEQASQLAQVAASVPAAWRPDWAAQANAALPPLAEDGAGPLALEAALGRIAVAWAGTSDYATDVLFAPRTAQALDALFVVEGLQPDPLTTSLAEHHAEKFVPLTLRVTAAPAVPRLHAAADGEDEAERAAACVLRHLAEGRVPVALVAGDRLLTRRISALLASRGVRLRDETGWRLSTTHAAAQLVVALRACTGGASSDAVLDWLKLAPAFDPTAVGGLEKRLRRHAVRGWAQAAALSAGEALTEQIDTLRAPWQTGARRLTEWLAELRALLQGSRQWALLAADPAGAALLAALGLAEVDQAAWQEWPAAQRRMRLAEFTRWVTDTLEAASFRPPHPAHAQVVVLPLSQLLGRSFPALVLPGADDTRLPAAPEPPGPWSAAQRLALHLPTREQLRQAQQGAWAVALQVPRLDVLWRTSDDSGEHLLPSPLVQALRLDGQGLPGDDPRQPRTLVAQPVTRPAPSGAALPTQPLSASAYEMLRACPYRFFALRQLGLQEVGELDVDVDKRDFGTWLHEVLQRFHQALQADPAADRVALMDAAAEQAQRAEALDEGEFLPFRVAWPALRAGYLSWLAEYEASTGAVFEEAEYRVERRLGELALHGTLDRVDRLPDGAPLVIDYKTETPTRTRERLKTGHEDTQLPFYALLSGHDAPRAAYLNVGEREPAKLYEPAELPVLAAALYEGIASDLARIAQGAPLRPLGEGSVCDWCDARGLCRKDFWT